MVVASTSSPPASDATTRRGAPYPTVAAAPCGSATSDGGAGRVPGGRVSSLHGEQYVSLPSGSVERRSAARFGALQQPGPQRSTAARVATTSAVVAASDAEQLPMAGRWASSQKVTLHQRKVTQGATWLVVVVVVVVRTCSCTRMSIHTCTRHAVNSKKASTSVLAPSAGLTSGKKPTPVPSECRFQASPKPHPTQVEEKDCEARRPHPPLLRRKRGAIFSISSALDALDPDCYMRKYSWTCLLSKPDPLSQINTWFSKFQEHHTAVYHSHFQSWVKTRGENEW